MVLVVFFGFRTFYNIIEIRTQSSLFKATESSSSTLYPQIQAVHETAEISQAIHMPYYIR